MNPYEILGVDRDASKATIKTAYLKLVNKYHPDRNGGKKAYEDKLKQINVAYDLINKPSSFERKSSPKPTNAPSGVQRHVNLDYTDNLKGFTIEIHGRTYVCNPGGADGLKFTLSNGDHVYTHISDTKPFTADGFDLRATVFLEKRFLKKGKDIDLPVLYKSGVTTTKWTVPKNLTDGSTWEFSGRGLYNSKTKERGMMYITFRAVANKTIFERLFNLDD